MIIVITFLSLICFQAASAELLHQSIIPLNDKHVFIAMEYETEFFIPTPAKGSWNVFYYDPNDTNIRNQNNILTITLNAEPDNQFSLNKQFRSKGQVTQFTTRGHQIDDWTWGLYKNLEDRQRVINTKALLDYDRVLNDIPEVTSNGISISRHRLGMVNGVAAYLVTYTADDYQLLREHVRIPLFMSWGHDESTYFYRSWGGKREQ